MKYEDLNLIHRTQVQQNTLIKPRGREGEIVASHSGEVQVQERPFLEKYCCEVFNPSICEADRSLSLRLARATLCIPPSKRQKMD